MYKVLLDPESAYLLLKTEGRKKKKALPREQKTLKRSITAQNAGLGDFMHLGGYMYMGTHMHAHAMKKLISGTFFFCSPFIL